MWTGALPFSILERRPKPKRNSPKPANSKPRKRANPIDTMCYKLYS